MKGPTFPSGFEKNLKNQFCTVGLNRTHLMLIGYNLPSFKTIQDTVHFKMKKLSNNSTWDFECVLPTSYTY